MDMEKSLTPQELQDEIALKIFEDDESALSDILLNYAPPIISIMTKKFKDQLNEQDIEDIVSISLMKFWNKRQSYDDKKGTIKAFFYIIAENTAKDYLRLGWYKAKQKEVILEKEYIEQSLVCEEHTNQLNHDTDCDEPSDETTKAIRQALDELPEIQRKIILADTMAGCEISSAELGKQLGGIPATTIRVYRKRAKEALYQAMKKRGFNI